jgi:hypothetical protein
VYNEKLTSAFTLGLAGTTEVSKDKFDTFFNDSEAERNPEFEYSVEELH